jgi:hypothetical protein
MHEITYVVSQHDFIKLDKGALMDRGANGNVGGDDVRIISLTGHNVNIQGVDFHQVQNIPIGTVGAKIWSQHGPFIGIFPQTAILGRGRTILSCAQLEYFGTSIVVNNVCIQLMAMCHLSISIPVYHTFAWFLTWMKSGKLCLMSSCPVTKIGIQPYWIMLWMKMNNSLMH